MATFMLYLSEAADGGQLVFHDRTAAVRRWGAPMGSALLLPPTVLHAADQVRRTAGGGAPAAQKVILRCDLMLRRVRASSSAVDIDAVRKFKTAQELRAIGKDRESIALERAAYEKSEHLTELRYGYTLGG